MMNKVVLVGELIQNVCVSKNEHSSVNSFIIATTRIPKDSKREHEVHFIYCKAFGKTIPGLLDNMDPGEIICISGQIATAIHNNSDGTKDYRMEVWTESVKSMPERLGKNEKLKNPSDMINRAVNLYNRYDHIGEKSILTLLKEQQEIKTESDALNEALSSRVKENHIEQLKVALEKHNIDNRSEKEHKQTTLEDKHLMKDTSSEIKKAIV